MTKEDLANAAILGCYAGLACFLLLLVLVFATGSTFGQRCDRAFPNDPARAALCVHNLSNGDAP